jgi:hypothetical protein
MIDGEKVVPISEFTCPEVSRLGNDVPLRVACKYGDLSACRIPR